MDLCSQAEHDEEARAILISPDAAFLDRGGGGRRIDASTLERAEIVARSFAAHGALIAVRDLEEALALANRLAPEHLELSVADAGRWVDAVRHAGAVFLGPHTPEAVRRLLRRPEHVLPTARTARFSSPLGGL